MTPSVLASDVDEARRDVEQARIWLKNASARSAALAKVDTDLLTRSRGRMAKLRDSFKEKLRKMRQGHLEQTKRHVELGTQHVSRQRERVVQLERDGRDTSQARRVLAQFEDL